MPLPVKTAAFYNKCIQTIGAVSNCAAPCDSVYFYIVGKITRLYFLIDTPNRHFAFLDLVPYIVYLLKAAKDDQRCIAAFCNLGRGRSQLHAVSPLPQQFFHIYSLVPGVEHKKVTFRQAKHSPII